MSTQVFAQALEKLLYKPPSGVHWADVVDSDDMYDDIPALVESLGTDPNQKERYALSDVFDAVEIVTGQRTLTAPAGAALDPCLLWPEDDTSDAVSFMRFRSETESGVPPDQVRWWPTVNIPKATTLILSDSDLHCLLCDFCRILQNCVIDDAGRVVRTLCESCRMVVSRYELNHCTGGTDWCEVFRYVDEIGGVAILCRGCYKHDEQQRQRRATTSRRDRRAAAARRERHSAIAVKG